MRNGERQVPVRRCRATFTNGTRYEVWFMPWNKPGEQYCLLYLSENGVELSRKPYGTEVTARTWFERFVEEMEKSAAA